MQALEVSHLCKSFGQLQAVQDLSFGVSEGAIFGLIGRNGAGKTTTIRMIMNVFAPDSGQILFHGKPTDDAFRRQVSYLPEERGLYKKMKVIDLLDFFLEIRGIDPRVKRPQTLDYLERFSLAGRQQAKVEDLSKGNQQKVQFIASILSDPQVLVLDEPFSGLDPVNTGLLKDIVLEHKRRGKIILFSTHLMDVAERMCDQIALIHQGRLMLNGSVADIKRQYSRRNVALVHEGDIGFLQGHPLVDSIHTHGKHSGVRLKRSGDSQALLQLLLQQGVIINKFDAGDISLQEIFLQVAGDPDTRADVDAASNAAI
jgi:ABC-2 type transport system ATP-binding protein